MIVGLIMYAKLSFLGAARNVTGSCYLLEANDQRILVDCGLYQERQLNHRNWEPFPVSPASIKAIFLTHAHIDHCGMLPKLVREGFRGKIYCTPATSEIAQLMLLDSAHLQEEDAAFKKKRHERERRKGPYPEVPVYTVEYAKATLPLFSPVDYRTRLNFNGLEVTFYDAGHVLGSSVIQICMGAGDRKRTILFSGDLGRWNKVILQDPTVLSHADYLVVESTYGDKLHDNQGDVGDNLAEIINITNKAGGNIIVPSFALQRSQEILYYLNELLLQDKIPHILVFLDSPLAASITQLFKRHSELFDKQMSRLLRRNQSPFDFPGLKVVETVDESKSLNHIKGTIMIIAGAGMCNGGRIKHHLVNNISRPESTILFVGYQATGTLGRQILDGAQRVRILGQEYPVRARITHVHGLSDHADRDDLLKWLAALTRPPKQVFVTHGEPRTAEEFARFLKDKTGWKVSVPDYKTQAILE